MQPNVYIDEDGLMKIQGRNQSDHNLMMLILEPLPKKVDKK